MKQILIATTNPGKIMTIKRILNRLGYEGLSFADLNLHPDDPELTDEEQWEAYWSIQAEGIKSLLDQYN